MSAQIKIEDGATATLDTMNNTVTLSNAFILGGAGNGALSKTGAGKLIIAPSSDNYYSGNTTIKAGTLVAGTANGLTGIGNSTSVYLGDTGASSNATLQLGSSTTTYNNNVTLQTGNTGLMTLNGLGNIALNGTVTLGSMGGNGKALTIANPETTTNYFQLAGVIQNPTGLLGGTAGGVTVGTSANAGKVTFNAANTYTGNTRAAFSALALNHPAALQYSTLDRNAADPGSVSFATPDNYTIGGLQGARSLALSLGAGNSLRVGNNNQSTLYSGSLSDVGRLTKIGNGTLTLSGTNTYTGDTTISAGTLALANHLNLGDGGNVHFGLSTSAASGNGRISVAGLGVTHNSGNLQTLNVPVALSAPQTFNTAAGDIALGGPVSGSNSLTKAGATII